MKIASIGGGNMAQAILGGLVQKGQAAGDCIAVEPNAEAREKLAALHIPAITAFEEKVLSCEVILIAVKPQSMQEALAPLAGKLTGQLVLSIAAGIRSADIRAWLGGYANIVRAMPNTPALIHAGISGLFALAEVDTRQRDMAEKMLTAVGKTIWFDKEAKLDAVTAVSGSGPAYVFYFIEALEQAATDMGFSATDAREFALQTFLGGAQLAASSELSPAQLRANVTSKRGTTEAAIAAFDQAGLRDNFIAGVRAAEARSRELGDELGFERGAVKC